MLRIPYFADLMQRPEGLREEHCMFCSSDGDLVTAQKLAMGVNVPERFNYESEPFLFESDKVELMGASDRPGTRSNRGAQKKYSVFSGVGRKEEARDAVEEFFREVGESEAQKEDDNVGEEEFLPGEVKKERAGVHRAEMQERRVLLKREQERRRGEAMDEKLLDEIRREAVIVLDMPSAASRARLGVTLDEARQQPVQASFREISRMARVAEEMNKQIKRRKKIESQDEQQQQQQEQQQIEDEQQQRQQQEQEQQQQQQPQQTIA
jgi:hypothetical protein